MTFPGINITKEGVIQIRREDIKKENSLDSNDN